MTKTIGAKDLATQRIKESERRAKAREKVLEATKKDAARYKRMSLGRAKNALLVALDKSEPLRLLFVARFLGQGEHREDLADLLRVAFSVACYSGNHRGARRAQEALGALLQSQRAYFACSCAPVEFPRMATV